MPSPAAQHVWPSPYQVQLVARWSGIGLGDGSKPCYEKYPLLNQIHCPGATIS